MKRLGWGIGLGVATFLCMLASGCHSGHSKAPPQTSARSCTPFADVDHALYYRRRALCREFGRSVSSDAAEPSSEVPLPRDSAGIAAACERGDARACFWAADHKNRGLDVDVDGHVGRVTPDPRAGMALYRRSCSGGHDNGCLWLAGLLRDHAPREELLELMLQVCNGPRHELCLSIAPVIPPAERSSELASAISRARAGVEQSCRAGRAEACIVRASRAMNEGDPPASSKAWFMEGCRQGSAQACMKAELTANITDPVHELFERRCRSDDTCPGVKEELAALCSAGNVAACYVGVNACTQDESLPAELECHPRAPLACGPPQEPTTGPPSCIPRSMRGSLLIDEPAQGKPDGWRAFQRCANGHFQGYLLEHSGPEAASLEEVRAILERHRGSVRALGAHSVGFGAPGIVGMFEGNVRVEKVLREAKQYFANESESTCFGISLTHAARPVPL